MDYGSMNLSELSCYAAGEIDDEILEKRRGREAVGELASRMKRISGQRMEEMSPSEILIYWEVFKRRDENIRQVDDLRFRIFLEYGNLEKIFEADKEEKRRLRGFCLDISRWALGYESAYSVSSFLAA